MRSTTFTALAVAVALLAACGGGGGSAGDPLGPAETLRLNGSNYVLAAQEALASTTFVADTGDRVGVLQDGGARAQLAARLALLGRQGARQAALRQRAAASQSLTEACSGGGTVTITANDANNSGTLDAGDSFSLAFAACNEDGMVLGGSMSAGVTALTGDVDSAVYTLGLAITLSSFTAQDSSGQSTGNGRLDLNLASTARYTSTTQIAVSAGFSLTETASGNTTTRSLSGFALREQITPVGSSAYTSSVSAEGTLVSSALSSRSITLATPTAFVRSSAQAYPASGRLTISGGSGSQARVTALDSTSVQIELDADGDGSYETSTTRAWSALI